MLLPVGTYTVDVTGHGYASQTQSNVVITQNQTTTVNFNLTPIPALEHDLTTLTDSNGNGKVEPGESFTVDERLVNTGHATATGISAVLSSTTPGITITQPNSTYPNIAEGGTGTNATHFAGVATSALACGTLIRAAFDGHGRRGRAHGRLHRPGRPVVLRGHERRPASRSSRARPTSETHCDDCTTPITLPFPVTLYGQSYSAARASSNGNIQFGTQNTAFINRCLPTTALGAAIIIYWDDLRTDQGGGVFTATTGSPPNRQYVVEWRTDLREPLGQCQLRGDLQRGQ